MPMNRGRNRLSGPPQPGNIPWLAIGAAGTIAKRPIASWANRGYWYLATDQSGGTLYQCNGNGTAWVQAAAAVSGGGSYTGTANQIIVTGTVLSTPQDIGTASAPTFGGLTAFLAANPVIFLRDNNAGIRMVPDSGNVYFEIGATTSNDSKAPLIFTSMNGVTEWMRLTAAGLFGIGAVPTTMFSVAEKFQVNSSGLIPKYNNIATVGNGVPSILGAADLTGQAAAKAATTLYTPVATGLFRISVYLQVTLANAFGTLGGTTGVTITYTDGDGSVAQSIVVPTATKAGAIAVTCAGSTTGQNLNGSVVVYAKTGVAIQYAIDYTAGSGTPMQYAAHLKCEAL